MTRLYEVYDATNPQVFAEHPIYTAETGRKALQQHLEKIGFNQKVKSSASNDVRFKVSPVCIENGRVYYDYRGGKRPRWYQVVSW
jgi:predicted SAM-dependent methyltransferase